MAGTKGCQPARGSQSHKTSRSPDRSLQLDCVKSESLVIVDQNVTVNTFPGLVHTARHTMERVSPEVVSLTARRAITTAGFVTGVKS